MDQFTYAERATDWRSNNYIAESFFSRWSASRIPSALDRMQRRHGGHHGHHRALHPLRCHGTRRLRGDPENSVFFDAFSSGDSTLKIATSSLIEGIGRPRVEKSFFRIVDGMLKIPDIASLRRSLPGEVMGGDVVARRAPTSSPRCTWPGGCTRRARGVHRDDPVRQRRALRAQLLQRQVDGGAGVRDRAGGGSGEGVRRGGNGAAWTLAAAGQAAAAAGNR